MGIDGLLRQLKGGVEASHLRQFAGKTVVVDAFSWLHKACVLRFDLAEKCSRVDTMLCMD